MIARPPIGDTATTQVNESGALVDEVSLLPGSYTLTVCDTEPGLDLHGTCAFVVGNEPGQVVRVALR